MVKTGLILLIALAWPLFSFGQTAANRTTLNSITDTRLPSGTGGVTAANIRLMIKDVVASSWNPLSDGIPQLADPDLTSFSSISGTNVIAYRTAANTWGALTIGSGLVYTPNVDPLTGGVLSSTGGPGGGGTVTSASFTPGNGFTGTITNATTTPAIAVGTTVTGIMKGNGAGASAAVAGTDYIAPGGIPDSITFTISGNGSVIGATTGTPRRIPYACTITGWGLSGNTSGSISIDIRKGTPSGSTVTLSSIVASAAPALSSQQVATTSSIGTWTTSVAAGDYLQIACGAATTITGATLVLNILR